MTNQNPTQTSWEQAILNKVTSNGERLALLERDVSQIKDRITKVETDLSEVKEDLSEVKKDSSNVKETTAKIESLLGWLKWIGGAVITIALSLVASFFIETFYFA